MLLADIAAITRINKPTGALLLFWPCAYACCLTSDDLDFFLMLKFLLACFLARTAGCIINDIVDKDIDAKVERTKNRPLAKGSLSVNQALTILGLVCCLGLIILCSLNFKAIICCLLSIPLVIVYPFMKRFTYLPQLFLGITFNYGIFVVAMQNEQCLSLKIVILYIGCVFWTIAYDTIYGYMDLQDDKLIGVKSLSIFLENTSPRFFIMLFYLVFLFFFYLALYISQHGLNLLQIILGFFVMCYFFSQISELEMKCQKICFNSFKGNNIIALILFIVTIV
ncbi:MAG: 4-hydroxybenzoate octaprenyltransferase [Rickettsiaceae bacterium]|nr:4-hydroxybenzoate octaprenyltransferase [Rickettsiaceae bacterium]